MVLAPYKVPRKAEEAQKEWLRSHGWPIQLVPMRADHVAHWDREVVPTIQRIEFERYTGLRPNELPRADAYWPYTWETVWRVFSTATRLPVRARGRPAMLARAHLWAVEAGREAPIGLLLGLSRYPFPASDTRAEAAPVGVFAWQLTVAPADTMREMQLPTTLALGRVMVDCAIQLSLAARHVGNVLLHADPNGGEELVAFYQSCFMEQLDETDYPMISATRRNDGRYYTFNLQSAGQFSLTHAHLRRSAVGDVADKFAPVPVMA